MDYSWFEKTVIIDQYKAQFKLLIQTIKTLAITNRRLFDAVQATNRNNQFMSVSTWFFNLKKIPKWTCLRNR